MKIDITLRNVDSEDMKLFTKVIEEYLRKKNESL